MENEAYVMKYIWRITLRESFHPSVNHLQIGLWVIFKVTQDNVILELFTTSHKTKLLKIIQNIIHSYLKMIVS